MPDVCSVWTPAPQSRPRGDGGEGEARLVRDVASSLSPGVAWASAPGGLLLRPKGHMASLQRQWPTSVDGNAAVGPNELDPGRPWPEGNLFPSAIEEDQAVINSLWIDAHPLAGIDLSVA